MDRTTQQLVLLLILLAFYCAAPVLALGLAIFSIGAGGDLENPALEGALVTLAGDPGAYLGVLHQMIVPVIAAITAANFKTVFDRSISAWLFILPLAAVLVCIAAALFFRSIDFSIIDETKLVNGGGIDPRGAIAQLFLNTASTLAVYVMLLVGLKIADKA